MTLVRLNNSRLVSDLAQQAFLKNFGDSYIDKCKKTNNTNKIRYHVSEHEKEFLLEVAVPGLSKDDIRIEVKNGGLIIETKEKEQKEENKGFITTAFSKHFKLSEKINLDTISAKSIHGILTVTLPKTEAAIPKPVRQINIA